MGDFRKYCCRLIVEFRPHVVGEHIDPKVRISASDLESGSPKAGDMIARNPKNHNDQWLVSADYFKSANFEPLC
jgi:hypothetical protein